MHYRIWTPGHELHRRSIRDAKPSSTLEEAQNRGLERLDTMPLVLHPLTKQPHCEHFRDRGIRCHGGASSKRQPSGTS